MIWFEVFHHLNAKRDLTFVKDTVEGFIEISKNRIFNGDSVNIGMNHEISVEDLVNKISEILNQKIEIVNDKTRLRPEKSEVDRLMCDNSKLIKHTNWKPRYDLDKGLRETLKWLEENKLLFKHEIYNK